jgi:hypothetical protein
VIIFAKSESWCVLRRGGLRFSLSLLVLSPIQVLAGVPPFQNSVIGTVKIGFLHETSPGVFRFPEPVGHPFLGVI